MLTGGCHCGYLRYEAEGAPLCETLCHCAICRRTTGAPAVAWFSVAADDFRFISGEPRSYASTETGRRAFCPRCGAQMTFQDVGDPMVDVTTASLDDPDAVPPRDHTWTSRRLAWMSGLDDLPGFPRTRREGQTVPKDPV